MKLYIAGPMTGYAEWNFPAFDLAAHRLRAAGFNVVNPAELDRVAGTHEFTEYPIPLPIEVKRLAMLRDLPEICRCDGIALLDGHWASEGCAVEMKLGTFLGLPMKHVDEWIRATKAS